MTGEGSEVNRRRLLEAGLLFLLSVLVTLRFSLTDGNALLWDEYYHLLAARSWADSGVLAVGDGTYGRVAWFSILVGWLFRTFGESVFVARLPGAAAMSLWVASVFLFVRVHVGRTAAWAGSLAFLLSPLVLINSVMVRFYAIAGLLFWMSCVSAYLSVSKPRPPAHSVSLALASVCFLLLGFQITSLTRLWFAPFGLWLMGLGLIWSFRSGRLRVALGGLTLLAIPVGLWAIGSGWLADLWGLYRAVPGWALDRGSDFRWYELLLRKDYPTLWTLLPLAVILSVVHRPRVGMMAGFTFGAGIIILSFAGAKAERYIVPLIPFFFIIWGTAAAELVPALRNRISTLTALPPLSSFPQRLVSVVGGTLLASVLIFVVLTNPGFTRLRHVFGHEAASIDRPPPGYAASPGDWEEVGTRLRPILEEVSVVITSNTVQSLFHVGPYDYAMRPAVIEELNPPRELGIDSRTGRPAIGTLDSLIRLVAQHPSGLIFGERWRWGHPAGGFNESVTEFVEANMVKVPLSEDLGVIAFRW